MATEIVSVGWHLVGLEVLSLVWLVIGAAVWVLLAIDFTSRLLYERDRWRGEADTPPALTAVAATTVLGTRFSLLGWQLVAAVGLVLAVAVWPLLLTAVIRHWGARMPGAAFLVCVSTQGIAVLSATLAAAEGLSWLGWVGLAFFVGGLALYPLAFTHFDVRQIWTGHGDHWVATGALAISALAGAKLLATGQWTGWPLHTLRAATAVVLAANLAGYVVLLIAEAVRPRPDYDIRRWATVFPLGMTAVAAYTTGAALPVSRLLPVARVLLAIAVAAWLYTLAALLLARLRAMRPVRRQHRGMGAKAVVNDITIAETDTYETVEGNIYFPPGSIKREFFSPTETHTVCPWKGTASYYTIDVGDGQPLRDAAWYYPEPKKAAAAIKDYVAFYKNRVDIVAE